MEANASLLTTRPPHITDTSRNGDSVPHRTVQALR